jgi:cytochrome c biogenesis protein CcdA
MIKESSVVEGTIKLLVYNIMFVLPLIVLAIITIKARSAMETSNIIREKLHIIKLITSFLFLGIALYYILVVIGVV